MIVTRSLLLSFVFPVVLVGLGDLSDSRPAYAQKPSAPSPPAPSSSRPPRERDAVPSVLDLLVEGEWSSRQMRVAFLRSGEFVRKWHDSRPYESGTFTLTDSRRLDIHLLGKHYVDSIRRISIDMMETTLWSKRDQPDAGVIEWTRVRANPKAKPSWARAAYYEGNFVQLTRSRDEAIRDALGPSSIAVIELFNRYLEDQARRFRLEYERDPEGFAERRRMAWRCAQGQEPMFQNEREWNDWYQANCGNR